MSKHTKGPWKLVDHGPDDYWEVVQNRHIIAHAYEEGSVDICQPIGRGLEEGRGYEEAHANARLIAAAPELYDLVKRYADSGAVEAQDLLERIGNE